MLGQTQNLSIDACTFLENRQIVGAFFTVVLADSAAVEFERAALGDGSVVFAFERVPIVQEELGGDAGIRLAVAAEGFGQCYPLVGGFFCLPVEVFACVRNEFRLQQVDQCQRQAFRVHRGEHVERVGDIWHMDAQNSDLEQLLIEFVQLTDGRESVGSEQFADVPVPFCERCAPGASGFVSVENTQEAAVDGVILLEQVESRF